MSTRGTAISKPLRDLHRSGDERPRVISAGVRKHRGAFRESTQLSPETDSKTATLSDHSRQVPHSRTGRQVVPSDCDDGMLLRDVARGDKAAMHMIFLRHQQKVFRFVLRLVHNYDLTQDIVSQVFLDVWRFAHRFEYRSRVSTWLFSIARYKALNALRRPTYQNLDEIGLLEAADGGDTPEVALSRKETSRILRTCFEELSPVHRQMVDLFYYHDCSVAEVSEQIGVPEATVKSRLFYARKHLAKVLLSAGFSTDLVQSGVR